MVKPVIFNGLGLGDNNMDKTWFDSKTDSKYFSLTTLVTSSITQGLSSELSSVEHNGWKRARRVTFQKKFDKCK